MRNKTIKNIALFIILFSLIEYFTCSFQYVFCDILNYFDNRALAVDKIYVLNLKRRPDRLQYITNELNKLKINFHKFTAIDGLEISLMDLNTGKIFNGSEITKMSAFLRTQKTIFKVSHKNFEGSSFIFDNTTPLFFRDHSIPPEIKESHDFLFINVFEIGCAYSHAAIIQDILKNNYKTTIIFEDDVKLYNNFTQFLKGALQNIPKDADIIYIDGSYIDPRVIKNINNSYFNKLEGLALGTHAYMLTRPGAKKIYKTLKKIDHVIDFHLPELIRKKVIQGYIFKIKVADASGDNISNISQ